MKDIKKEMTTLVLEDSTYSLTFMQPEINLTFVESGKVEYDVRRQHAKFTVMSAVGVDWNGAEPRRLVDVPYVVPWQRDPGDEYVGKWQIGGDYMQVSVSGLEEMYFKRLKSASGDVEIDVQKKQF